MDKGKRKLKVVIAAGGDGTRLGALNPEKKAKSLLFFAGKPLISHQLEMLTKENLDILLSFSDKTQVEEFNYYVKIGLIPKYNYYFGLHNHFDHQRVLFRNKGTKEFIKDSDFLFTHGDLLVKTPLYDNLISAYLENNCSVIIKENAKVNDQHQFVLDNSFLTEIKKVEKPEWRYGGVFVIKNKDQADWLKMCESEPFRSLDFFDAVLERGSKIYVLDLLQHELVLNINTPIEYGIADEYFLKEKTKQFVLQ